MFEKDCQPNSNDEWKNKCCDVKCLVQMIMLQAQKPIVLTGGPFYVLSLETFRIVSTLFLRSAVESTLQRY